MTILSLFSLISKRIRFYKLSSCFFYFSYIPRIPTPIPRIPTLIPRIPTPIHCIPTLIPRIPTLIPCIPSFIPLIPTLIPGIPIIPTLIHHIPTLIPRIPIILTIPTLISRILIIPFIPFPNPPFQLLQITHFNRWEGLLNLSYREIIYIRILLITF